MSALEHVLVVVPARNEEARVGACLDSLATAVAALERAERSLPVTVVVVLDGCTDRTAEVVARRPWAHARPVDLGVVGAVRRHGVQAGAALLMSPGDGVGSARPLPDRVWLAHTDADSRVPSDWLTGQVALAERGFDLVLGSVEPEQAELSQQQWHRWQRAHRLVEGHGAVHGANLGVRLACYEAVGGFAALAVHEDIDLTSRLRRSGVRWVSTDLTRVRTSGRARGRVAGGFADYLSALEVAAVAPSQ